jgi:hypothetical protein
MASTLDNGVETIFRRWVPPGRCDGQTAFSRLMAPVLRVRTGANGTGAFCMPGEETMPLDQQKKKHRQAAEWMK